MSGSVIAESAAMTARSPFRVALALTLIAVAAWTSVATASSPQALTLLLFGAGLAVGAHALKRDTPSAP